MAGKPEKPENIMLKLRQVDVLQGQAASGSEAVRQIGVTIAEFDRQFNRAHALLVRIYEPPPR